MTAWTNLNSKEGDNRELDCFRVWRY